MPLASLQYRNLICYVTLRRCSMFWKSIFGDGWGGWCWRCVTDSGVLEVWGLKQIICNACVCSVIAEACSEVGNRLPLKGIS